MTHIPDWRRLAQQISDRAVTGSIQIFEFHNLWPDRPPSESAAAVFYDDLEEGIEHFPGTLTGAQDVEAWHHSELGRRIMIDRVLLRSAANDDELLRLRAALISDIRLDWNALPQRIEALRREPES